MPDAGPHRISDVQQDGMGALCLTSPEGLRALYVPDAGMVCASLRLDGAELLGQRQGLRAYARDNATMGIPLLHPWANRLARYGYAWDGTEVEIPRDPARVADDGNGLPIHGLSPACFRWRVAERSADDDAAHLCAELDAAALPEVMELFPFPHRLRMDVVLRGSTLAVTTTLFAVGDRRVPVAFGYHPYFRLPDLPRAQWEVEAPLRRRALLDDRLLPTGRSEPAHPLSGPIGDRELDDLFPETDPAPVFRLAGGGRRIDVAFGPEYPVAVIYAPSNDDVVCFEPMTAQTNPFEGPAPLRFVPPGQAFAAHFRVTARRG
jgi:galactose mutarotase-like enzyme